MTNERESGSSICWVRDTENIFKSIKIKNRKESACYIFRYIHIKRECNSGDHTPFCAYNYNIKNKKLGEITIFFILFFKIFKYRFWAISFS